MISYQTVIYIQENNEEHNYCTDQYDLILTGRERQREREEQTDNT